jgi:hypothetical protein
MSRMVVKITRELRNWSYDENTGQYTGEVYGDRTCMQYADGTHHTVTIVESVSKYADHRLVKTFSNCYIMYDAHKRRY